MGVDQRHGVFEKRAPALLDNLFQACKLKDACIDGLVVLAPLFVFIEFLFLFGYRPVLKSQLDGDIKKAIDAWKASKTSGKKKN